MKKVLLLLFILMLVFGGYICYDEFNKEKIPVLDIEEEIINIDELYVYGTHFNMHGNIVNGNNLQLVLYNGEFIEVDINVYDDGFNLSEYVNDGLYLDDIPRGDYFLFLRDTIVDEKGNNIFKYYSLNNNTDYKETIYYTFSTIDNKIVIGSEESYPTMMIKVFQNKDKDIYDIVIDPGHGGMDGGADRNGYKESDFTLNLALKLQDKFQKEGFTVKLTREEDQLSLNETLPEYGVHGRAVVPYEVNAKYLFSLHMNSNSYASVNGLEVYTADLIDFALAKSLVSNITLSTGLNCSSNKINKVFDGIYTKTFSELDIDKSIKGYNDKGLVPYDITTRSNYYYIIRETGGIITGAYVDDRNDDITGNPYVNSNIGTESYLLELGYISNKNNLDNMINNMDSYVDGIFNGFTSFYDNK